MSGPVVANNDVDLGQAHRGRRRARWSAACSAQDCVGGRGVDAGGLAHGAKLGKFIGKAQEKHRKHSYP